ncbi:MAG: hypothetical protein CMA63_07450 [Euryarchaeota archaeon]|nr:hypothetical protein [Euryarchaeota archaeon]|tara:strand:+ start:3064 stop:6126 length:3063 start_codon:yes stop_codon:yes gene_type:complete
MSDVADVHHRRRFLLPVFLVFIMAAQVYLPFASAANMASCTAGGSVCDEYDSADDGTPHQPDWIEGTYDFDLTSTSKIQLELVWAIREFDREALGLNDPLLALALSADGLDSNDGAPADLIRSYFDTNVSAGVTFGNKLKQEVDKAIQDSLSTGFNTTSDAVIPITDYVNTFTNGGQTIACNYNSPDTDAFDEGAATNNVFDPPICLRSQVTINIPTEMLNLPDIEKPELERAYQGFLIMGAEITTKFDLVGLPGHDSTYTFSPPSYGVITSVDGVEGGTPLWNLNHLGALQGEADLLQNIQIKLAHLNQSDATVVSIPEGEKALDLQITLDLRDESAAMLDFTVGLYYLDETTMTDWGISLMSISEDAKMPLVTSDGIRLAYHNGLVDLTNISDQFPIATIAEAISSTVAGIETIQMDPMTWVSESESAGIAGPLGGINYTHSTGCTEIPDPGKVLNFCLKGPQAMGYANPVYLQTTSQPFSMQLLDVLKENNQQETVEDILSVLTTEDFQRVMNAGLEVQTMLESSYLSGIMPSNLPASELELEIILPPWIQTKDGSDRFTLTDTLSGNNQLNVSFSGINQYDWRSIIKDDDQNIVCKSTQKTCVSSAIVIDAMDFDFHEFERAVSFEFALDAGVSMHRIAIPTDLIPDYNGTQVSMQVLPSDLLRLGIDISSRLDAPLTRTFEFSALCGTGNESLDFSICDENITFSLTNTGLTSFVERIGEVLTIIVHESFEDLQDNEQISVVDVSDFDIQINLDGLGTPPLNVGDKNGITLSVKIPKVKFKLYHDGTMSGLIQGEEDMRFAISTSNAVRLPVLQPMVSAMQGINDILVGGVFDFISSDGVTLPATPGDEESIDLPIKINTTIRDDFQLALSGPLTIIMPVGLKFIDLQSTEGNIRIEEVPGTWTGSRQQITYTVPAEGIDDTISFRFQISWWFFFLQLKNYFGVFGILFVLAVRRRRKKKKRKKAIKKLGLVRKTEKVSINANEFADLSGFHSQGIHGDMDTFKKYENKKLPPLN